MKPLVLLITLFILSVPCFAQTPERRGEIGADAPAGKPYIYKHSAGKPPESLEALFASPPSKYEPQCYVQRMNGNLTREGITADFEAMKRVGISGIHLFDIVQSGVPKGEVDYATPEWKAIFKHTLAEAKRLGLDVHINNTAGWSGSGGPWVTNEQAMYHMVWEEKEVVGPAKAPISLKHPAKSYGFYRDIAVLAVRLPGEASAPPALTLRSDGKEIPNADRLSDRDGETGILFSPKGNEKQLVIDMEYPSEVGVTSLHLLPEQARRDALAGKLQFSADGKSYVDVCDFDVQNQDKHGNVSHTFRFRKREGRFFRLVVTTGEVEFRELRLGSLPVIHHWEEKSGFTIIPKAGGGFNEFATIMDGADSRSDRVGSSLDGGLAIKTGDVVDVTAHLGENDTLNWDVPEGRWLLMRIGYRPTGAMNEPSGASGKGLACDKLDPATARSYMQGFFKNVLGSEDPKADGIAGITFDSWEVGTQNWTHKLPEEFRKRRGYEILPYLPVLAGGKVVGNTQDSERFLWDFRKTISELIADAYYGTMMEICTEAGLQMYAEPSGRQQFLYDPVHYQSKVGVPMGEFWTSIKEPRPDCKAASSAAHVYGKKLVGGEAFTSQPQHGAWQNHPFKLKILGDKAFAQGVNQLQFHRYAQQPWMDRVPGMTMGKWGFEFERTLTWWEQSAAWIAYISRCQFLLQEGKPQADVCYLTDGGAPGYLRRRDELAPPLPAGFDYDGCDTAAVTGLMEVENGDIVTPSGTRYRVLVLPPSRSMQPALLEKLERLVSEGATIVGPRPLFSPSLEGQPQADAVIERLGGILWGECDGKKTILNRHGKGRVYWSESMTPVFKDLALTPDVEIQSTAQDTDIRWIHRTLGEKEIYFVANSIARFEDIRIRFRVPNKTPAIFDPETGTPTAPLVYEADKAGVTLPLRLDPAGSLFVVFSPSENADTPIETIRRHGEIVQTAGMDPRFKALGKTARKPAPVNESAFGAEPTEPPYDIPKENKANDTLIYQSENYFPTCETYRKGSTRYFSAWKPGEYELEQAGGKKVSMDFKNIPAPMTVDAPWKVDFMAAWGPGREVLFRELKSWSVHSNPSVRYFSGTAAYRSKINVAPERTRSGLRSFLDLGRVEVIAEVKLNGNDLGIFWKPPYRMEITDLVRAGENDLEIRVTNLWPNRLIGDENEKDISKRLTYSSYKFYQPDSPLLDSGLFGPVSISSAEEREIPK